MHFFAHRTDVKIHQILIDAFQGIRDCKTLNELELFDHFFLKNMLLFTYQFYDQFTN